MRHASGTRRPDPWLVPKSAPKSAPRLGARLTLTSALALGLALSACGPFVSPLATAPATVPNTPADSRGVITYATYQVVVVRDGDTVESVANRLGIAPAELAARNSLPPTFLLRQGEILLLPDSFPRGDTGFGGDVTGQPLGWSPERAAQAIDGPASGSASTMPSAARPATSTAPAKANPFQNGQSEPLIDPVRHRVEAGETAYSIARLYGVSVTALASWNGLGPDLAVRENQELLIPIVSGANQIGGGAAPGQGTEVPAPPSAAAPLPADITPGTEPASPDLGQYRTPQGGRLQAPVKAKVSRPYNTASPNGVGFAVAAGTPVRAAAAGEVALISEELGGLGTIVLIRHKDDLMTTYSTLSDVTVKKGQAVTAGEKIGVVAARERPELQFDVFRGTTSVDPETYLGN